MEPIEEDGFVSVESSALRIQVDLNNGPRLTWFSRLKGQEDLFLADAKSCAYSFDASVGGVFHIVSSPYKLSWRRIRLRSAHHAKVERELHFPTSEDDFTPSPKFPVSAGRYEFIYGLGETGGTMLKEPRKYTMSANDSLAYDWQHGAFC
jgi:alpha-glucosidase